MGAIGLIVLILLLIAAALWYIPKARRQFKEERERRLKVAQGIYDDEEPDDKKKKKKKKKRRKWFSTAIELPRHLEKQLANVVPKMVDVMLKEYHATRQAAEEVEAQNQKYQKASEDYSSVASLSAALKSADNLDAWLAKCVELLRLSRQEARICRKKYDEYKRRNRKLSRAIEELNRWFSLLYPQKIKYDLDDLEPELERNLQLAAVAKTEINIVTDTFQGLPERLADAAEESDAELEESVRRAFDGISEVVAALISVKTDKQAVLDAIERYNKIDRDKDLDEPERPLEDDVAAFMEDALEWAQSLQEAEIDVSDKVAKLAETSAQAATLLEGANDALASIEPKAARNDEADDEDEAEPDFELLSKAGLRVAKVQIHDEEEQTAKGPVFNPQSGTFEERTQRRRSRRFADRTPVTPKLVLTEDQECRKLVVKMALDAGKDLLASKDLERWQNRDCAELTETGTTAAEKHKSEELASLIRKIGFAIGQLRNVRSKLEETKAVTFEALIKADLDAADTERFIQQHGRWLKDSSRQERDKEAHTKRKGSLQTQQSERLTQLKEAAATLRRVLGEHLASKDAFPCSPELDIARRASAIASEQFAKGLLKDKEEAAEAADKAKKEEAKRKKAREEEEERRRRRRRMHGW